jgi:hypothetical protein
LNRGKDRYEYTDRNYHGKGTALRSKS